MQYRAISVLTALIGVTLASCGGTGAGPLGIGAIAGDRNLAAAEPLFFKQEQDCLGSADLLIGAMFAPINAKIEGVGKRSDAACARIRKNLQYLIQAPAPGTLPTYKKEQRNEIIDALIASSNQKCTRYSALLKNADGAMNAGLSVGAIITGGLGGILGGVNTAKALAGSSSILSGSRAALNDTYLSNQTIHVLNAAFEKARREQRRIITNREACTVEQYTLMRGVEDAFSYHNSCSLVSGLAETALSIERSENPGLNTMRIQMNELANIRHQMTEFTADGPITPIAATPKPVSLEKLVTADKVLVAAQSAMDRAATELDAAEAAQLTAKADPENGAALTAALKTVETAKAKYLKLTTARDAAGSERNAEVRALVHTTSEDHPSADRESRSCPFDA